ncbi:FHA domain-containing protein [Aureimonas sp. AU20]|uniref:FHA domain-containing protein n=1 Tax=Aureimonas sp. AU20 TaxID=1349819 RepID=UPI001650DF27|nr:FHA domain-containing protein [Aureimonas sp. AU20]
MTTGSLLIGRSPVCDWVLPDPDRVVSGRHCRIDSETNRFVLTDLSTNGTFVDEASEPLGPGAHVTLRDGQALRLGDARVLVQLTGAASSVSSAPETEAQSALIADDWFASPGTSSAASPVGPDFGELLTLELAEPALQGVAVPAFAGEPPPSLASLCEGLSGRDVLAALEEVAARWEPELAARLKRDLAFRLDLAQRQDPAFRDREAGGA